MLKIFRVQTNKFHGSLELVTGVHPVPHNYLFKYVDAIATIDNNEIA